MTSPPSAPPTRRPLPALVFLIALTLLAALVWWRVLDRDSGHAAASPTCTPSSAAPEPTQLPEQRAITVTVLNSTKRQGIATSTQRTLVKDGFQAPAAAANDSKAYPGYSGRISGVAEIRYGQAGRAGAQLLHYYFPAADLVRTNEKDATVLVSLGAKFRRVTAPKQVAAALKADGIKLVPVTGVPAEHATGSCAGSGASGGPSAG